jgi:hypothetical protein
MKFKTDPSPTPKIRLGHLKPIPPLLPRFAWACWGLEAAYRAQQNWTRHTGQVDFRVDLRGPPVGVYGL